MFRRLIVLVALLVVGTAAGWWWTEPSARVERVVTAVALPADARIIEDVTRSAEGCFLRPCPQRLVVHGTSMSPAQACEIYAGVSETWNDPRRLELGTGAAVCAWVGVVEDVLVGAVVEEVGGETEVVISGRPVGSDR